MRLLTLPRPRLSDVRDLSLIGAAAAAIALVVEDIRPLNLTPKVDDPTQVPSLRLGWLVHADTGRRSRPATPEDCAAADLSDEAGYRGVFAYAYDTGQPILPGDQRAKSGGALTTWLCLENDHQYLPTARLPRQTTAEPELLVDARSTMES